MSVLFINPFINLREGQINNIFVTIANEILELIKSELIITNKNNYINLLSSIHDIVKSKINIYIFSSKITNIHVEIYNQDINIVLYEYFIIFSYYYKVIYSVYENFINGSYYNNNPIVYEALDADETNKLIYAIAKDDFYYIDNIIINLNLNTNGVGIIIKDKPSKLIISIYWYFN